MPKPLNQDRDRDRDSRISLNRDRDRDRDPEIDRGWDETESLICVCHMTRKPSSRPAGDHCSIHTIFQSSLEDIKSFKHTAYSVLLHYAII